MFSKAASAIVFALSLAIGASASAQPRITGPAPTITPAPTNPPGPNPPPLVLRPNAVLQVQRPDFEITHITPIVPWGQNYITGVTVTINDNCSGVASGPPYVNVYLTDPTNGSLIATLGYNANGFTHGAHIDNHTVQLPGPNYPPQNVTVQALVNQNKLVLEAWSGNNTLQINPNIIPFPPSKNHCLPQNYEQ